MPDHAPRVSVIVPTYQCARFLPEAVASLQAQTLEDWEAVVVDDGSTDDTPDVVASLIASDRRLRYVRRPHAGVSAARNYGLAASSARYVQFLDADDRIEPEKLWAHATYLDEHNDLAVVYGDAAAFGDPAGRTPVSPLQLGGPIGVGVSAIRPLVIRNALVIHAPLSRRRAIEDAGAFREGTALLEDWELWLRCAIGGAAFAQLISPNTRALVRIHQHGASRRPDPMLAAAIDVRARVGPELPAGLDRLNAYYLSRAQAKLALNHLRRGRARQALAELLRAAPRIARAIR